MFFFGLPNIPKMSSERDYDGLARCLEHRDRLVRLQAAQALAELKDGRGWRYLLEAVGRPEDHQLQATAAEMLGELGHPRAIDALKGALPAARGDAVAAIREALRVLGAQEDVTEKPSLIPEQREIERQPEGQSVFSVLLGSMMDEGPDPTTKPLLPRMEVEFHSAEQHLSNAVQLREGELQERALVECSLALWLSPQWAYAWYLRGVLLEDLERGREAFLSYRRSLALDNSLKEAQEAYADLEESLGALPDLIETILGELVSDDWVERRDGAAWLGEWLASHVSEEGPNFAAGSDALLEALSDPEREVRYAIVEALRRVKEPRFVEKSQTLKENSWLLRFAILQALSDLGAVYELAQRLSLEMSGLQERNPVFVSQKDPLLEQEYALLFEVGTLALERTENLEKLLELAEGNAWEEVDSEDAFLGDEEDEEADEDLQSYVDETSLMVAIALERLALRRLDSLSPDLLNRLAAVPDLTLLDVEGWAKRPVVVHDFSELRSRVVEILRAKGI